MEVIAVTDKVEKKQRKTLADKKPKARGQFSIGEPKPKTWGKADQTTFEFEIGEIEQAIYAKLVQKVGNRTHWEDWANDIAKIARTHIDRIRGILGLPPETEGDNSGVQPDPANAAMTAFIAFAKELRDDLNDSISDGEIVEMLAQHLITKPVFDALFDKYSFASRNPISKAMQGVLDALQEHHLEKEADTLQAFYDSVKLRAEGIDNAAGKQKIVVELYDKFFRNAFPRMTERLGIVYTPVEVVDFIIHSVAHILKTEFSQTLGSQGVHIIDPFTGTGTFIARLLQSGLIKPEELAHKYRHEIHANEIVLLAYYIAAINIEETFHGLLSRSPNSPSPGTPGEGRGEGPLSPSPLSPSPGTLGVGRGEGLSAQPAEYIPFEGICLTDTFQLYESGQRQIAGTFPENTARVKRQKASPIRVVIANPPYSANQGDTNNNNQNLKYRALDARIGETYAARSTATNKNSIYDSYVRAIRWASDRIDDKGVIGFVTNGYFIDGNAMDGLRACLCDEFSSLYVFNLRGNQRTSGEVSRQEGGKVFGSGSRNSVAITLLVKNPSKTGPCTLCYHDIGDYLSREEKLASIKRFASVAGIEKVEKWTTLQPNDDHDWINQRDPAFEKFMPIGDKSSDDAETVFSLYSRGLETSRDAWCYNFSVDKLAKNIGQMISFYNTQVEGFAKVAVGKAKSDLAALAKEFIETDQKKIAWSSSLLDDMQRGRKATFRRSAITTSSYRAFCKLNAYYNDEVIHRMGQMASMYPIGLRNITICTTSAGNRGDFSAFIASDLPDLNYSGAASVCQAFPLYLYERADESGKLPFDTSEIIDGYRRRDAITDAILKKFQDTYGPDVRKEDIFYYVYGILHSPEYRRRFAADLKKMLPRIPLTTETDGFWAFSGAGRKLAEWHLNYETVEPWPVEEHSQALAFDPDEHYQVRKMTFARPTPEQKAAGLKWDKTRIIYNADVTLSGIPLEAYEYVVNGKPAIEWVMERYQVTRDKASGIVNDPNDWRREHHQPRYIIDLLKRVVRVSIETMQIVNALPALNELRTSKQ
jgi:predicted helicase